METEREREERENFVSVFFVCRMTFVKNSSQKFVQRRFSLAKIKRQNETTKRRKFDREFFQEREERDLVFRFILRYSREENVCEITCKCTRIPREQTYWREEEEEDFFKKSRSHSFFSAACSKRENNGLRAIDSTKSQQFFSTFEIVSSVIR